MSIRRHTSVYVIYLTDLLPNYLTTTVMYGRNRISRRAVVNFRAENIPLAIIRRFLSFVYF